MLLIAAGVVSDFTEAVMQNIRVIIAREIGDVAPAAVETSVTAGSVVITATVNVPGNMPFALAQDRLTSSFSSMAAASALLGITVTSDPAIFGNSPSPPPSPAPPPVCNDLCNWSQLKQEPLLSQQNMCVKYQPTSINAPLNAPAVAGEFDLYHCKQAEPGDRCPGDYQMCYGNSYYVAPTTASLACPASLAGICGTCPNQDKCGKEAKCLKKKAKGKCHKKKWQKKCGRTCSAERIQRAVEKARKKQEKAAEKAAKKAAKLAEQQG
jgi:hypothetical protein